MNSLFVRKGDTVKMLSGKNKGKTGKVTMVNPEDSRIVVDGLNIITKHRKPRSQTDRGGIRKVAGSVDASNVQIVCPACSKTTRVGHMEFEGKKVRMCKKCFKSLDVKATDKKALKKAKKEVAESVEEAKEKKSARKPKAAKPVEETAKVEETVKEDEAIQE
ncbi:MAG: 50S ribosomal protein L24 [Firmicutes bacterium]|nr:50S ribosomal protein L24 [Bacillota bacterium]